MRQLRRIKKQQERFKLTNTEYRLSLVLAKVIVVILAVFVYFLRFIFIALFKSKRWLYRFSIAILITYSALNTLNTVVYAPKSEAMSLEADTNIEYSQEERIENYVITIFGKDAKMAIAIHKGECSPFNKTYPKCGPYITSKEYSCGIFQINLKAHWNKVPVGNTFEEKCKFLEDPFNNTLVAYKIFQDSNWYPWSAFTSNKYKMYLK